MNAFSLNSAVASIEQASCLFPPTENVQAGSLPYAES